MSASIQLDIDETDSPDSVAACDCHNQVTEIKAQLDQIMEVVSSIYEEVGPTLDSLKKNPMLKMFFS